MTDTSKLYNFAHELGNKYTALFNVYRDEKVGDFPLSFLAIYHRRDERYMISKRIKVYGVENQEIIFAAVCEDLDTDYIQNFQQTIESNVTEYVPEDNEHMSTTVLGIVIVDQDVEKRILKEVKRYRKLKFLKFGLHGWLEMYTVLVNLKDRTVHVQPKGKQFVKSLEKVVKQGVNV